MHSFSITDSYFVLIEQPLNVSFKTVFSSFLLGKPLVNSLKWRPNKVHKMKSNPVKVKNYLITSITS